MAAMLNMIPVSPKQNIATKNQNSKGGSNSDKSQLGFAKALDAETDKDGIESKPKVKNDDNMQMMSTLVGGILPIIPKVDKIPVNTDEGLISVTNATQTQLPNVVSSASQIQLPNVVSGVSQTGVSNLVSEVSPTQLTNGTSGVAQTQLAHGVLGVAQTQLVNGIPSVTHPAQLANVVPGVAQDQFADVVLGVDQLANAISGVTQNPSVDGVPRDSSKVGMTVGKNTSQNQLATLLAKMAAIKPQLDSNQLGEFAELQAQALQMQNKVSFGQVQGIDTSNQDTGIVENNSVLSSTTPFLATMGMNTMLGKNNKQFDGKKIVAGQMNVPATEVTNNFDLVESLEINKLIEPQLAVAVGDKLLKENVDGSLPDKTVKTPDAFTSLLNQQGIKIESQTMAAAAIKQGPAPTVPDPYNITSQIVDQVRLVTGAKNTEMIIQLKPEHLGELTFKVTIENGVVSTSFHSNNAEVRSIIESSLPQLKQDLFNHGIKMDNMGVYAGLGQNFSNDQQSGGYQQPVIKVPNKKTEEDFFDILESTDSANRVSDVTGVDYRV